MKEEFIEYVNEVIRNVPNNDDNLLGKLTKIVGITLSTKKYYDSSKIEKERKKFKDIKDKLFFSMIEEYISENDCKKIKIKINNAWDKFFVKDDKIGKIIYWSRAGKDEVNSECEMLIHNNFNYDIIGSFLYSKYSNKFIIEQNKPRDRFDYRHNGAAYSFSRIESNDKIFEFESNKKALKDLKTKGTYLFFGDPGSGKSSFVFSESMKDKKIIIISASNFCMLSYSQISLLLKVTNPDIFLIEEFDKVSYQLDEILIVLERLNQNEFTTVLTANSLKPFNKAVIRPKRVDKIIHFKNPNHEEIKELINYFSNYKEHNEKLFNLIKDKNLSNAYIVDLAKKLSEDFDDVKDYIDFLDKYLEKDKEEK